jgi:hypothetical protein
VVGVDGTVYVLTNHRLTALNPNGTLKWAVALGWSQRSPAVGLDGTVYISSGDTAVAVRSDGAALWRVPLPGYTQGSPAIGTDGTVSYAVYRATEGDTTAVCAIAPDGSRKWAVPVSDAGWVSAGGSGMFYVTGHDLAAISSDGSVAWLLEGQQCQGQAALDCAGDLFVPRERGLLVVHQANDTMESVLYGADTRTAVLIDANGDIIVPCSRGENDMEPAIVCLDSGLNVKWRLEVDGELYSAPGIGLDGTTYIGSTGGYLYAIKGSPLAADAPWPKFGHDSRNSGCAAVQ